MTNPDLARNPSNAEASLGAPQNLALSEARLHANRENAQHSTGPRTAEGKKRSSLRRSKDPLALFTLYESRLSRRLLQTLKQFREIQAERRALEQQQLQELYLIATANPELAETLEPAELGFVCSALDWQRFFKRRALLERANNPENKLPRRLNRGKIPSKAA
jgi:hypothetical protein